ncbi:MAG: hypothetical protein FWD04_02610 [Conexibacteraceae bacterium]|nr:hypothetical protein [Conexibacteraceae bacterium]
MSATNTQNTFAGHGLATRAHKAIRRIREIASEMDYAQRRVLEIRTGLAFTPETKRAIARAEILRLEVLHDA